MKNLIYFVAIILLNSCGEKEVPQANNNTPTNVAVASAKPVAVVQRDTTTPPKRNYIVDTSRPKDKIKADFPFDIPMTNAKREVLNSENVLGKNGKPTVVLFWLTTCYPCRLEMKAIKEVYPQWKKEADFNLVAVSTDFPKNYENFISRVEKEGWEWDVFHDTNREFRKVMPGKLNGLPQTFVFDKNGEIAYHKRKYQTGDEHKLFEVVKKLAAN